MAIQCEGCCSSWFHCSYGLGLDLKKTQYAKDDSLPSFNSINAIDVFHFDFQKNLPTPKLTVGKQFYIRLLWTYLFGIFSASSKITCGFMWNELVACRGANDVLSCLYHFIYSTPFGRTGAKHSIWWVDNCAGPNKNNCIVWFFQDFIRRTVYSIIDYKFLIVGHTYGPTDRCFGVTKKYLNHLENVYTPHEWQQHVRDSATSVNSRVEVISMEQCTFLDYRSYLHNMYTERNTDIHGMPLHFSKVVRFNF